MSGKSGNKDVSLTYWHLFGRLWRSGSCLVCGPENPCQFPGASGWIWRPHRHVCGRCAVDLALWLDLAYAYACA